MHPLIRVSWAPILLLAFNYLPNIQQLYLDEPQFDKLMHTLGGAAIAYAALQFVSQYGKSWWKPMPQYIKAGVIVSATLAIGVVWEWYEYIADFYRITPFQSGLPDTMEDFAFDTLGALIILLAAALYTKNSRT